MQNDLLEKFVIPENEDECMHYADEEAQLNWKAYRQGSRTVEQLQSDIRDGKMPELDFAWQNREDVVRGVRMFGKTPDSGVDLVLRKIGNVQIKTCKTKYVNDLTGIKRDSWPSVDSCLLVVAFIDDVGNIQFMCQAPSTLVWKKSKYNDGWYLERSQFIPWTNDEDVFQKLGAFPKAWYPIGDLPEDA